MYKETLGIPVLCGHTFKAVIPDRLSIHTVKKKKVSEVWYIKVLS